MTKRAVHIVSGVLSSDARVQSYVSMLVNAGWQVDVISYKEPGLPSVTEADSVRVFRVSDKYQGRCIGRYLYAYGEFYFKAKKLIKQLHEETPYNMIHINNMPNFLIGMTRRLVPKPFVILDMHDIMSINYKTKFGRMPLTVKLTEMEEKWSLKRADAVICADHGQKEALEVIHGYTGAHVIMNLTNPSLFKWSDHSWKQGKFRFVYSGTVAHRLGVDRAVAALKHLPEHIVLRVVGDGDGMNDLKKAIRENRLEERVELIPRAPIEKIPGLLQDCHAGVIPSRKTDATDRVMMPVKFMEYCASGIPSVVADLQNLRRYVSTEQALFFEPTDDVDLRDAMHRIATDDNERNRILLNIMPSKQTWNMFSATDVYEEVLSSISR